MISSISQELVACRPEFRPSQDVLNTPINLCQSDRHDFGSIDQTIDIKHPPPSLPNCIDFTAHIKIGKRPAQLRRVLDPLARSKLFPIDQTQPLAVNDHITRLQVIMDKAAMVGRQICRHVMELSNHAGQLIKQRRSLPPITDRLAREP